MADFFPLISRAVKLLPQTAGFDDRNAIYNKARAALERQLRVAQPALSDDAIAKELGALEASIAQVEQGFAPQDLDTVQALNPAVNNKPAAPAPINDRLNDIRPTLTVVESTPNSAKQKELKPKKISLVLAAGLPIILGLIGVFGILAYKNKLNPDDFKPVQQAQVVAKPAGKPANLEQQESRPQELINQELINQETIYQKTIPVAVRASLYVENPTNPQLKAEQRGAIIWRLENNGGDQSGSAPQTIHGTMEFPDAKLNAEFVLSRNLDASFPASHTIMLRFLPTALDAKTVKTIALPELRADSLEKGPVLQAVKAPDADNTFLIALLNTEPFMSTNIDLLKKPGWIFFELRFNDGKRAELVFEKGAAGERVFDEAFAAWGE